MCKTEPVLLSIDWDYFSGCAEHVFDAPIWGVQDTHFDRLEAWQRRAKKRNGNLSQDFPLQEDWPCLKQFFGVPSFVAQSHASAYAWLQNFSDTQVLNLDSHHDLYSQSGDETKIRPGNWAGLALQHGFIKKYTCVYPPWHEHVRVAEGFDLARTWQEIGKKFAEPVVELCRAAPSELRLEKISALLLVQSPAWTNPEHDQKFFEICEHLNAQVLEAPLKRF